MNDATLTRLKIVVEQVVQPVRATMARKARMREELLAHLVAIFDEEAERLGDERAALATARRRFGEPVALSEQIQDTVPWWNRLEAFSDEPYYLRPGESLWHFAGRNLLCMSGLYAIFFAAVPLVMLLLGKQDRIGVTMHVMAVACMPGLVSSLLAAIVPDRLGRALYGTASERSRATVALCGAVTVLVFPAISLLTYLAASGDLSASFGHMLFGCCFAPVAPVVFVMMARQFATRRLREEEWASLTIEP